MQLGDPGCIGYILALRAVFAGGGREVDAIKLAVNMPDLTRRALVRNTEAKLRGAYSATIDITSLACELHWFLRLKRECFCCILEFGGWNFGEMKVTMTWAWH